MKNAFLVGQHIYLRALEVEDASVLQGWKNDREVMRNTTRYRPANLRSQEQWIERSLEDEHEIVLGIVLRAEDRLIGCTGLHEIDAKNRKASLGIMIGDKTLWGRGAGTEAVGLFIHHAFDTLNLNRVWLKVYEDNLRGIRAYERVGFRREGVLRQDSFRDGRYWNTIVMGVLREEWRGWPPSPADRP